MGEVQDIAGIPIDHSFLKYKKELVEYGYQNGNLLWAEYSGGDILKGSLIGTVLCNGELDFVYHHMNQNMQIKTGKCHSVPTVLENGKIELSEQWQWTSGDYSKGESLLVEV